MASSPAPVMPAQVSAASYGRLQLAVTGRNDYTPIENAVIQVTDTGNPDNIIEELTTDNSGKTPVIELPALLFLTVWRAAVPNPIQSIISPFRLKVIPI